MGFAIGARKRWQGAQAPAYALEAGGGGVSAKKSLRPKRCDQKVELAMQQIERRMVDALAQQNGG